MSKPNIMKFALGFLFLLALTVFAETSVKAQECKVTDPTGTPLNVRSSPNGRVNGKVRNGTVVYIETYSTDDNGKPWAKIATYRGKKYVILGWVFREFISCL